jgi:D-lyxose ketol-isomerase
MITRAEWQQARQRAWAMVKQAGVVVREAEFERMDVADVGLGELAETGLQILTLASTAYTGVKLLILMPNQVFPQHRHPPLGDYPGKEEIFRGQWGEAYLYVPGDRTPDPRGGPPAHRRRYYDVWHEIVLRPGDQHVVAPNTWHWFQAGPDGAVVWSFSSTVTDAEDQFRDPEIIRQTVIYDDA